MVENRELWVFSLPTNKVLVVGPGRTCSSAAFLFPGSHGMLPTSSTHMDLVASSHLPNNLIYLVCGDGCKRCMDFGKPRRFLLALHAFLLVSTRVVDPRFLYLWPVSGVGKGFGAVLGPQAMEK